MPARGFANTASPLLDASRCRWREPKRRKSRSSARWTDPAEEKRQTRRRLVVDRVDDLVEAFSQDHVSQIRSSARISNLLRRDVIPYWGTKSIHEIKKRDVSDLVSQIAQRNAHAGHRLLKTLKTFFRWCVGRAVLDFSPAEGIASSDREVSRDRVLDDQELAWIIGAAQNSGAYGEIVEILALTGQRREEVARLKWSELDERSRTWSIPVPGPRISEHTSSNCPSPAGKSSRPVRQASLCLQRRAGKTFKLSGKQKKNSMSYRGERMAVARPATNTCLRHGSSGCTAPRCRQNLEPSVGNDLRCGGRLSAP